MIKSVLTFFLGVSFMFYACNHSKVTAQTSDLNNFEVLYQSEYGGSGMEEVQVIDNQDEFFDFWAQTTFDSPENTPKIDFSKKTVIVKHLSGQNSGGNTYDVESVYYDGAEITVRYTVSSTEIGTTAITNPLIVIAVDKVENPKVEFKNSNQN